jgi:hypothetical protein
MSILSEFVRYLGHSHFAIKSIETGKKGAQEQHFSVDEISKAENHIEQRNGKRQLWINLQKMKPDSGSSIGFSDIKSYDNLYIDLDCIKSNGFKNHAATEEERTEAISKLPILKHWLESHGLRCGLELHTGNGAGMVLPIPETRAEPVFVAKLATFLGVLKADIPNVDTAMFDPPRVIGIPGTLNTKQETEDRKNHMREVVGDIPDRIEDQALLDFINSLEPDPKTLESYRAKYNEPADIPHEAGVAEEVSRRSSRYHRTRLNGCRSCSLQIRSLEQISILLPNWASAPRLSSTYAADYGKQDSPRLRSMPSCHLAHKANGQRDRMIATDGTLSRRQ